MGGLLGGGGRATPQDIDLIIEIILSKCQGQINQVKRFNIDYLDFPTS